MSDRNTFEKNRNSNSPLQQRMEAHRPLYKRISNRDVIEGLCNLAVALCQNGELEAAQQILCDALHGPHLQKAYASAMYWILRSEIAEELQQLDLAAMCYKQAAKYKAQPFATVIQSFRAFKARHLATLSPMNTPMPSKSNSRLVSRVKSKPVPPTSERRPLPTSTNIGNQPSSVATAVANSRPNALKKESKPRDMTRLSVGVDRLMESPLAPALSALDIPESPLPTPVVTPLKKNHTSSNMADISTDRQSHRSGDDDDSAAYYVSDLITPMKQCSISPIPNGAQQKPNQRCTNESPIFTPESYSNRRISNVSTSSYLSSTTGLESDESTIGSLNNSGYKPSYIDRMDRDRMVTCTPITNRLEENLRRFAAMKLESREKYQPSHLRAREAAAATAATSNEPHERACSSSQVGNILSPGGFSPLGTHSKPSTVTASPTDVNPNNNAFGTDVIDLPPKVSDDSLLTDKYRVEYPPNANANGDTYDDPSQECDSDAETVSLSDDDRSDELTCPESKSDIDTGSGGVLSSPAIRFGRTKAKSNSLSSSVLASPALRVAMKEDRPKRIDTRQQRKALSSKTNQMSNETNYNNSGSVIQMKLVNCSPSQAKQLGTKAVLSPVRRSQRFLNQPLSEETENSEIQSPIRQLLNESNFTYVPNPALSQTQLKSTQK